MTTFRQLAPPGAYGSLPPRRIDQLAAPAGPGMLPAPPGNQIVATRVIVTGPGEGVLAYSPTRAAGNLVASTGIAVPFFDPFGNSVLAGDTTYFSPALGAGYLALNENQGSVNWYTASTEHGPWIIQASIGLLSLIGVFNPSYINASGHFAINNGEIWLAPSGQTSGVIDTANIVAALGTFFTIHLLPGDWYIISGNVVVGLRQHIWGGGKGATRIHAVDNAALGFKAVIDIENSGTYSIFYNAGIHHMLFDGTGTVRSNAVSFGDIAGIQLDTLQINNFPNGTALYGNNRNHWTEQLIGEAWIQNCFNAMALDSNGGTNSYDRMTFTMWVGLQDTQSALRLIGGTGLAGDQGIQVAEGMIRIFGNFQNGNTGGGAVIMYDPVVTKSRNLLAMQIDVGVEIQGSGTTNPKTISFHNAAGVDYIARSYGTMFYFNNFLASNNNGNFGYDGIVFGDFALETKQYLPDVLTVTATAPLNGSVFFEKMFANGKIFVKFAFSIPAGGTFAANQAIIPAVSDPNFLHTDNTIVTLWANGGGINQGTSAIISSTGAVQNNGPVLSPVGSACFVYGQATISNSY